LAELGRISDRLNGDARLRHSWMLVRLYPDKSKRTLAVTSPQNSKNKEPE
jgi:hypothetical protein